MSISLEAVHPVLMSSDPSRSILFFTRLGFTVTFQDRPASPRYVAITRDGVTLHLQWLDESQWACTHDRPTYRFLVQDVDGLFETFQDAGAIAASSSPWAAPGDTPWGTREFHVLDPDGNGLQFYRPRPGRSVPAESTRGARDAPIEGARMTSIQGNPGEIHELARYEVRPEALDQCLAAIHEFVAYVRAHEPGAIRYEVWQEAERPTRFVHIFVWKDAEANRLHGESAAVQNFASILYPNCLAPVEFVEYTQVDANAAFRRI